MNSRWVGESIGDDAEGNVDDLFDSLGLNGGSPSEGGQPAPEVQEHVRSSRVWAPIAGALGVGLLVALGAVIWLLRSPADGEDVALETSTGSEEQTSIDAGDGGDADGSDLEAEAEKIRGILGGLGLSEVEVAVLDGKVYLGGSVPTDQDLSTIRNAVISSSDPALVNMNDIVVGGPAYENSDPAAPPPPGGDQAGQQRPPSPPGGPPPGSPPPGFVPPTVEQQENLQRELNRVLTETPLVFDVGSTELNDVQLKVLDTTIIGLLEGHPGVPVRLVGYTDEQGDDFTNKLLSFDRAEAVQRYLISSGVPEHILRVEGRGEESASGDKGADRRVEIEVIRTP